MRALATVSCIFMPISSCNSAPFSLHVALQIELSLHSCALFVDNFLRKQRPFFGDHGSHFTRIKTKGFAPESVFTRDFTRFLTVHSSLLLPHATCSCSLCYWHDDDVMMKWLPLDIRLSQPEVFELNFRKKSTHPRVFFRRLPKKIGVPRNIIYFHGIVHCKPSSQRAWGTPMAMNSNACPPTFHWAMGYGNPQGSLGIWIRIFWWMDEPKNIKKIPDFFFSGNFLTLNFKSWHGSFGMVFL